MWAARTPVNEKSQDLSSAVLSTQRSFTEQQSIAGDAQEPSGAAQSAEQPPLGEMSELDRFGLAGLLRMIHSDSPDVASLAVGQDLMTLGLDLNQPEYVFIR
jgi:CCR4-NOT transcription complex subunit 2